MIQFFAEPLHRLAANLGRMTGTVAALKPPATVNLDLEDHLKDLRELSDLCTELGLTVALPRVARLIKEAERGVTVDGVVYCRQIEEIQVTINDQLSAVLLMRIPPDKIRFWQHPDALFGEMVATTFPDVRTDIGEFGRCFAAGRNTAAVFHLMRVAEVGLRALAQHLGVAVDHLPSQDSILKKIDGELNAHPSRWPDAKFYREMRISLTDISGAWRNYTMHAGETYTEEEALDIFGSVRGLMQRLCANLQKP